MIFKEVAEIMGIENHLILSVLTEKEREEEKAVILRRSRTTFKMINIPCQAWVYCGIMCIGRGITGVILDLVNMMKVSGAI